MGANQPIINIEKFFGPFRINLAGLVVITMCEEPMASNEKIERIENYIKEINPEATVISTVFQTKTSWRGKGQECTICYNSSKFNTECFNRTS